MQAKNLKFLQLFESFVKTDYLADKAILTKAIKNFMELDYQLGVDVWDYLATTRENEMLNDETVSYILGDVLFTVFYDKAPTKCIKAINDTPSIRRAVYQYSPMAGKDDNFMVFTDLMVTNKIESCEEIFKCLLKNERISYGDTLKRALERVFIELLKKNPTKIEMSKKLSALVLTYVKKIKTDEKAMLEQRIREIM